MEIAGVTPLENTEAVPPPTGLRGSLNYNKSVKTHNTDQIPPKTLQFFSDYYYSLANTIME